MFADTLTILRFYCYTFSVVLQQKKATAIGTTAGTFMLSASAQEALQYLKLGSIDDLFASEDSDD